MNYFKSFFIRKCFPVFTCNMVDFLRVGAEPQTKLTTYFYGSTWSIASDDLNVDARRHTILNCFCHIATDWVSDGDNT